MPGDEVIRRRAAHQVMHELKGSLTGRDDD
jgi:hypothetical protein